LADFADELKKARQFGSMTTFGRGLPRGGEMSAVKSLQRQEDILRALYKRDPVVSLPGCLHVLHLWTSTLVASYFMVQAEEWYQRDR